jgi:hypothetical protein
MVLEIKTKNNWILQILTKWTKYAQVNFSLLINIPKLSSYKPHAICFFNVAWVYDKVFLKNAKCSF